jgi:hypothetical protein
MAALDKFYLVGTGKISGTYADSFHRISHDGKIGLNLDRDPSPHEIDRILSDVKRHRAVLLMELADLDAVESLFNK